MDWICLGCNLLYDTVWFLLVHYVIKHLPSFSRSIGAVFRTLHDFNNGQVGLVFLTML